MGPLQQFRDLGRLFRPDTIAMIGGEPAAQAVRRSDRLGFEGEIWPVHPTRSSLEGREVFRSLDELPGVPDAAFVAVNRWATIEIVHRLAELGCGGAVLYASGFAEAGTEGGELQKQLLAGHDMPLLGPNCYGTINTVTGAALWPDVHGCRRVEQGPALISQSGNIALNLTMNRRGVRFSQVISLGNQASVTVEEALFYLAHRPEVTAVGLYLESISDPIGFGRAALAGHETQTPMVVLKTGRTARAERITRSHTAALATPAAAYNALFERYGIPQVDSLPEFLTTLGLLDTVGPLKGNRLVSLSCSGGEAALVADRAIHHPVIFEPFSADHAARVRACLSDLVTINNPLDYHTFIWGDVEALERCFTTVLSGPFDAALLVLDWPSSGRDDSQWWPTLIAFASAVSNTGTPGVIAAGLSENLPERIRRYATEPGLGVAYSIDEALAGLGAVSAIDRWPGDEAPTIHMSSGPLLSTSSLSTLDEPTAKQLLRTVGIVVPEGVVVNPSDPTPVDDLTSKLAFPLVTKRIGPAHKSETGGVITGIGNQTELRAALGQLGETGGPILVEEQVAGGEAELLVSIRRERLGMMLTLGAGGRLVELLDDTQTVLLPATEPVLRRATDSLRIGHRLPENTVKMLADLTHRLTELIHKHPELIELEINPLILTPDKAWTVDALATRDE
ncbi:MAG: acetate--CoA ligase family protein [bacterium]|nr:acetate--CoA ligase family protein [bacterium]